jgi:molybdopterin converting factor small subunit
VTTESITVRLRVPPVLRHELPAFAGSKEIEVSLPAENAGFAGATVADLAAAVGLDLAERGLTCAVNGRVVDAAAVLHQGDEVRLMPLVAGG